MFRVRAEAPRGLRVTAFGLVLIVGLAAVASDPAEARRKRARTFTYQPAYAAIVVDANSGKVMHAANADALRHPASLTKIMTLYMLFERLDAGRIKLDSPLSVSEHAAEQSPTKLGLKAGSSIVVDDAIKGIVTRSANDAAVVVAENLGGSEREFARMMTAKAHALGMDRTEYHNASGLPDDDQVTTARDQALLARAIQERFPRYYKYFSIRSFQYKGQTIGNHNHLLGRVEGVDGIKTGYIRASGFNLVTSVHRDNHYVVAVVLGGASASSRDAKMRSLLDEYVDEASTKRTATMIAERAPQTRPAPPAAVPQPAPTQAAQRSQPPAGQSASSFALASAAERPVRLDPPTTAAIPTPAGQVPGSNDPIRPVAVKTLQVKPGRLQTASMAPLSLAPAEAPQAARPGVLGVLHSRPAVVASAEPMTSAPATTPAKPQVHSGWMIQVGAYTGEDEAKQRLGSVKGKASKLLADAEAFTESVLKGKTTYYRARFAGLEKDQAEAACKFLKRNDVECIAIKN